jgi:hypothetical protein
VRTVAETPLFARYADDVWSDAERLEFIDWMKFDTLPVEFVAKLRQGVEDVL